VVYTKGLDIQEHARTEEEPIRATLFDLLSAYRDALKRLLPPPRWRCAPRPRALNNESGKSWRSSRTTTGSPLWTVGRCPYP